jgi:hypothetical protein
MPASDDVSLNRRLEAFLDEALSVEESAEIERRLRSDAALRDRLAEVIARRDRGDHSLGAVWQRERLTCADRAMLGSYLLDVLDDDERKYLEFHLNVIGCRYCRANLEDLEARRKEQPAAAVPAAARREHLFKSSVGGLRKR